MGFLNILINALNSAKPVAQNASKAVVEHVSKNAKTYATAAGGAVVAGSAYVVGKAKGHTDGKKEGTAEQAMRDEQKFNEQHQRHENDRAEWNKQKKEYEDILNDIEDSWD